MQKTIKNLIWKAKQYNDNISYREETRERNAGDGMASGSSGQNLFGSDKNE